MSPSITELQPLPEASFIPNPIMQHRNRSFRFSGAILAMCVTGLFATTSSAQGTLSFEKVQCLTAEQEAILGYLTLEVVDDARATSGRPFSSTVPTSASSTGSD